MQVYMGKEIKAPVLKAVEVLFSNEATKLDKAKAIKMLWDAFQSLKGLPEPTKKDTWHPNSHKLIELRDWLFERCFMDGLRLNFLRRLINFAIVIYDFDPPWRWVMDSVKDEALKKDWLPRGFQDTWTEDYTWWKDKIE